MIRQSPSPASCSPALCAASPPHVRTAIAQPRARAAATSTSPSAVGKWGPTIVFLMIPVAAALIPGDKLVVWSADSELEFDSANDRQFTQTAILNLATGAESRATVSTTAHDMFCPGGVDPADGEVIVTGGIGTTDTSIYNPTGGILLTDAGADYAQDRIIYMTDTGHLDFGTYPGATQTIESPRVYNDGKWHFVVATQASDGMHLYVDGALASGSTTTAQSYLGHWQLGGLVNYGWPNQPSGTISDVAVFAKELTAAEVKTEYTSSPAG